MALSIDTGIQRVHLIFKTHLDLGFTDLAGRVVRSYFDDFFPTAIALAEALRQFDPSTPFRWTVGSWLLYTYLETAKTSHRRRMEAAVERGDILWHALPFTTHTELMDAPLLRAGLRLSQQLDARFGRRTIAAKMTDVPGHTRAIVPPLAEANVRFLHIGLNPASMPPDVPALFVWRDRETATELIVMLHQRYGETTVLPGTAEAVSIHMTGDNLGPPSAADVRTAYALLRARFPNAQLIASSLDAVAEALEPARAALPVITAEIGDTWIHGAGSDPTKMRRYRELLRLHAEQSARAPSAEVEALGRRLLLIPEHTWGLDEKTHLAEETTFEAEALRAKRKTAAFQHFESSWHEQRAYIDDALAVLEGTPLHALALQRLRASEPAKSDLSGFEPLALEALGRFETAFLRIGFDATTGAIIDLHEHAHSVPLAAVDHPLALLRYQRFTQRDYERFWSCYIRSADPETARWAKLDFTKPGMESSTPPAQTELLPRVVGALLRRRDDCLHVLFQLQLDVPGAGMPMHFELRYALPLQERRIEIDLQWFGKIAQRLPEAYWLSFVPRLAHPQRWRLEKLGRLIDPCDVVSCGARGLHAVGLEARYDDGQLALRVQTWDAPLIAPGRPALLDFDDQLPDLARGLHINLYNNVWGTNFPMWFDDDARFRFTLRFD
ncbi:MAG: DUF5054 domain-containing protein [Aggregatilineales bacterium]